MTNSKFGMNKLRTLDIAMLGTLMGIELVLSLKIFTIGTQFIQFNFVFLIVAIISYWYGHMWSMLTAGIVDVIGTFISGIPYFPGFTLSAILGALIYSLFFYKNQVTAKRVFLSQILISLFVNAILNTLWVTILYKTPFVALFPLRLLKQAITSPIQMALIYFILNSSALNKVKQRLEL